MPLDLLLELPVKTLHRLAVIAALATMPGLASAVPLYDYFGPLPEATFGGTGIPNEEVAVSTQFEDGDTTITVALSATQRFFNPALTNDGAGTYFAQAGSNFGGPGSTSTTEGALWNFNYYIKIDSPTRTIADYDITLFYDFDPTFDNGPAGLGTSNISGAIGDGLLVGDGIPTDATLFEGSQNLLFDFLADDVPGYQTAPTYGAFDPNATGEYNFAIQVARAGWSVEQVRMDVQVVPIPAAAVLFPSALAFMGWLGRRRRA